MFRVGPNVTRGNGRKQSKETFKLNIKKNILTLKFTRLWNNLQKEKVETYQ